MHFLADDGLLGPDRLQMKVGRVVKVEQHPEAENLYIEQIDLGELMLTVGFHNMFLIPNAIIVNVQ